MIKNIEFKRVHELDVNLLIEADAILNSLNCLLLLAYYIDKMGSISYLDHLSDFYVYGRPLYTLRYLYRKAYLYVDTTIQEPLKIDVKLDLLNLNLFFVYLERAFGELHLVEGLKSILIKNYTDDMQLIIEAEADDQGDLLGVIAWFIDTIYNDNFEVYINGIAIGELRDKYGNMPATFTIPAGYEDTGTKRINFSEPVTVTMTGNVTLSIAGTPYQSGDTIPVASSYHTLTINNPGDAGTITFGKRKQITYLYLSNLGSSVITVDITGMKLTYLYLSNLGSSVITGDITGMKLTYLYFYSLGSSVITGDITGMKLTQLFLYLLGSSALTGDITGMELTTLRLYSLGSSALTGDITQMEKLTTIHLDNLGSSALTGDITQMKKLIYIYLDNLGSSVITGNITGMELTALYIRSIGSSLTYGTNSLNITSHRGIQLLGDTVFSASEYIQLFADAATCVTEGKWTAATKKMTISGGENPGWSNVEEYYYTIVGGGVTVTVPLAWETGVDPFPEATDN